MTLPADPTAPSVEPNDSPSSQDIAIIGMAGRFPGARDIEEFWDNLVQGRESIRRLTDEELLRAGVARRDIEHPDYVKACPVLDDVDKFDAAFFGISPRDASVMDPAHRFFLEVTWQALEHSGNAGLPEEGRVGVFAGSGAPLYWMNNVQTHREILESMGEFLVRHTGNDMNFLATRASYDLDLRGPSVNVQTACSSALVAAHWARQSLLARECDMALVGGSTILVPQGQGYHYKEGEILSPDGHCRPFDHKSAGTVFGSGTACLVLKRLDDALDNGDTVYAVIKGSAINNDGAMKVGFLAPGVEGQADVIQKALEVAGVPARSVSYIEAHGTGTSVGDPIELTALEQAFSTQTEDKQFCAIGSVKSNIGHLGEAAAAASLVKVALALSRRTLPPSLGYEKPNPRFDFEASPFFVNAKLRAWDGPGPLRAGITALGAGGTNCHLILEEPPAPLPGEGGRDKQLLLLSAKTKSALKRASENLAAHLEAHPELDLADAAYTLALGRRGLTHRRALVAGDAKEAIELLRSTPTPSPGARGESVVPSATASADPNEPGVVYTFPGGGAQYARMCYDLYDQEPVFRAALDECFAVIDRELDPSLRSLLFAPKERAEEATKKLQRPAAALPTLFAVEYSLARLFDSYGIRPVAYVGHSMGEYVAACLAGVFSVRDGLRLVHLRGRLFETTEKGKMIGVSLSEEETRALMPAGLSIAAVNAPELCVASGPIPLVDELARVLTEREIDWTPIHIDVAAHSSLLEPILGEFRAFCRTIEFRAPTRPVASNLTGRWLTPQEATDPEYWVKHLRGTVRFSDCVETVLEGGSRVFLEIGPGRTLTTLVGAQKTKASLAVNSVRHPKEPAHDVTYALLTLGKVWAAGARVDFTALYDEQLRNRVALPAYPFEGQSYWVEPRAVRADSTRELIKRENQDEWFSVVGWEQAPLVRTDAAPSGTWLLLGRDEAFARQLAAAIEVESRRAGSERTILLGVAGPKLKKRDGRTFELRLESFDDQRDLLELLQNTGVAPSHVVSLLSAPEASSDPQPGRGLFRRKPRALSEEPTLRVGPSELEAHFFTPARLGRALGATLDEAHLTFVTQGAFSVRGEETVLGARLTAGPAQVIPRELPELVTRWIDLGPAAATPSSGSTGSANDDKARAEQLARELLGGDAASPIALRAPTRWARRLRPVELPPASAASETGQAPELEWLSDGDVVFITGGLGGIGLTLASHLASRRKLRLALLSREGLPPRAEWPALLAAPGTPAGLRRRITAVQKLEAQGAQVLAVRGDVVDEGSLELALNEARSTLGSLDVVLHAAGVMDDEPLATKTDEKMQRVLGPKVLGTQLLDRLVTEELKAFVVMSSVASLLGLPGQVDYTAANAFLDAFAEDRQRQKPGRTLAINWNAWRDVGMVVDAEHTSTAAPRDAASTAQAPSDAHAQPHGAPARHPWLGFVEETPDGARFARDFSAETDWLLSEHRIEGADALIPGTGFVELARAAFVETLARKGGAPDATNSSEEAAPRGAVELRGVTFSSPFQVAPGARRSLSIDVEEQGGEWLVDLSSSDGEEIHMTAEARLLDERAPQVSLSNLRERAPRLGVTRDGFLDQDFVRFGRRWQNLRETRFGAGEAVIELELAEDFKADLGVFAYHPALLDMATGAAQSLIPGFDQKKDFYVPFGYDRVVVYAPIPGRATSHVRLRPESGGGIAAFDVDIFDETGSAVIHIEGFTMKRVDASAAITRSVTSAAAAPSEPARPPANPALEALLREAITPPEGVLAFERALAQRESSQIIASSVDVDVWLAQLAQDARRLEGAEGEAGPSFSRPSLSSDYAAPEGRLELDLAGLWSKLLGIADVGALDDFFELGGNSLIAVRFFARVKKELGVNLPLSTLFQAPTIRALAAALRAQGYVEPSAPSEAALEPSPSSPPISGVQSKTDVLPPLLIRPGKGTQPLFFVHDGLGEVLLYRNLALRLPPEHPVYGLEPESDGGRFLHTRIVDMARAKVERIRSVQPQGPYLLAGLCAGGVIAFEAARQLEDAGEEVRFVGIIDAADVQAEEKQHRAVQGRLGRVKDALRPPEGSSLVAHLGSALPVLVKKTKNFVQYEVESRLERARNKKKVAALRAEEAQAETTEIEFLKLYELAHKEHRPRGVFQSGRVVLFRATQGNGTLEDQPFRDAYVDPLLGWGPRVSSEVTAIDVPGGHSSALQEPFVETLAQEMQSQLERVLRADTAYTQGRAAPPPPRERASQTASPP